jgi:hypothetical protein
MNSSLKFVLLTPQFLHALRELVKSVVRLRPVPSGRTTAVRQTPPRPPPGNPDDGGRSLLDLLQHHAEPPGGLSAVGALLHQPSPCERRIVCGVTLPSA